MQHTRITAHARRAIVAYQGGLGSRVQMADVRDVMQHRVRHVSDHAMMMHTAGSQPNDRANDTHVGCIHIQRVPSEENIRLS